MTPERVRTHTKQHEQRLTANLKRTPNETRGTRDKAIQDQKNVPYALEERRAR